MRIIFILFISLFSFGLNAKVIVKKEFPLSPSQIQEVEKKIVAAENRPYKEYPTAYTFDWSKELVVWCPANMPTEGKGCSLSIKINESTSMQKELIIVGKSQEIEKGLSGADPNKTQDHIHFGSIFSAKDSFGSHYYCQPEGELTKKAWSCFLYTHEAIN